MKYPEGDLPTNLKDGPALRVDLPIRPLIRTLLATIVVLFALHCFSIYWLWLHGGHMDRWAWVFNLGEERNIPTTFTYSLFLLNACLLLLIGYSARVGKQPFVAHWFGIAAVFLFLALDEEIAIHDTLSPLLESALNTSGALSYAWVIPYLAVIAVLGVIYIRFMFSLPMTTLRWFIPAAVVYIMGAAGLEMVEAKLCGGGDCPAIYWPYLALVAIEEIMEMLGLLLFTRGLLGHLSNPVHTAAPVFRLR